MFFVPTSGLEDWKKLLADPEKHWREGYSAHALASRWQATGGFPREILALLTAAGFSDVAMPIGLPEHKVALPGGARASQTDLWILARTNDDLISIAVEGKVRESFGPTLAEWFAEQTEGKAQRWAALCDLLGIGNDCDQMLRYQLVHRTASAILEAKRFHAYKAVMLVHSFSAHQGGFADFPGVCPSVGRDVLGFG